MLHFLYILVSFGLYSLQGYASNNSPETEILALVKEADSCRMSNNLYRALKLYEEAYRREASTEILREIIQCHYERGSYQRCIDLYQAVPTDSLMVKDLKMKYFCFSNIAQGDSAVYYGRLANSADPYDCKIVSKLAHHYNTIQLPDTALYIVERYCKMDSTSVFVNRQKAYAHYLTGDYPKALHEYRKLKAWGDRNESTLYYLALCYAKTDADRYSLNAHASKGFELHCSFRKVWRGITLHVPRGSEELYRQTDHWSVATVVGDL